MIIKFNRLNFSVFTVKGCVQLFLVSACLFCFVLSNALTNFSQLEKVAFERFGGTGLEKTKAWQKFLLQASTQSDLAKVTLVNNFVNKSVKYASDTDYYSLEDFWATPLGTLLGGFGDCEDYAITKYVLLKQLNIKDQNLRIQYVLYTEENGEKISHMVLLYYPDPSNEPLVLDNLVSKVQLATTRVELTPVYSFNATGYWVASHEAEIGSAVSKFSKWRDLLTRMKNEGIQLD